MSGADVVCAIWMLDSSTFIHALIVGRIPLVVNLRSPIFFPEYVYRFELGLNAHALTKSEAESFVARDRIRVRNLTLADLDRLAELSAPRRIGLGEIACALIAEREGGGVLCDDLKAKRWLASRTTPAAWESIEDVLMQAAILGHLGEGDLVDHQRMLSRSNYECRSNLQIEYLQWRMNRGY